MSTTDNSSKRDLVPLAQIEPAQESEREIDLLELFYRLLERIKYIIAAALLGALLAGLYTFFLVTPLYEATAKLYVLNSNDSAVNLSDLQIGSYLATDYLQVFSTWEVHEMVLRNLGLDYSYDQIQSMLSVSNPSDTRILSIKVTNPDPVEATKIANEYANVARAFISDTMATEQPNILSVALQPTSPASPNKTRNIILGFLLGGILACAIIIIQFILDDRIRTTEDIQRYAGLTTLATMPVQERKTAVSKSGRQTKRR